MTTNSWSSRIRHDSDAVWREWRDDLITRLAAVGLGVAETNITAGAGARASTNTEAGYAVFYLNDSLHATAPIYIRFGFGTGIETSIPRIRVTVGTSTNGSGVLGGTALSTITSIHGNAAMTSDVARTSYLCCVTGFFGMSWKVGASIVEAGFFICRSCDTDGTPNATGAIAHWADSTVGGWTKRQMFRFATAPAAYTAATSVYTGALGLCPAGMSGSGLTGGDAQAFLGWMGVPEVSPIFGVCGVFADELTIGGTFSATLLGSTARTFITLSNSFGPFGPIPGGLGKLNCAMLWE